MQTEEFEKEMSPSPLFELGQLVASAAVDEVMQDMRMAVFVRACLTRHLHGDWSHMGKEDYNSNITAVVKGYRIMSAFSMPREYHGISEKLWFITEHDRSVTTILFPSDY